MKVRVFYAGLLHSEHEVFLPFPYGTLRADEIPDGAYIYFEQLVPVWIECHWLRSDFAPVLLEDVPKELLMLTLLLS